MLAANTASATNPAPLAPTVGAPPATPPAPAAGPAPPARPTHPSPSAPYCSRTARAAANVVPSATVGPDPITLRSSPTTSDTARVRHEAAVAAASQPPLIADKCLRTVLSA